MAYFWNSFIGIGIANTFFMKYVLVLTILFKSIVNNTVRKQNRLSLRARLYLVGLPPLPHTHVTRSFITLELRLWSHAGWSGRSFPVVIRSHLSGRGSSNERTGSRRIESVAARRVI